MKKHYRLITAVLSLTFCISAFGFTAYAEDEDINPGGGQPGIDIPTQPPQASDIPDYTEPQQSYDYSSSDNSQYQYSDSYSSSYDYNNGQSYYSSYDNDYNNYYNYNNNYNDSSSSFYVGGGQSYVPPDSTAASASVYNVDDRKIDDSELNSKDWKDIQTNLSKAGNSGSDSDDFAFIKNNDSKSDNGEWMLILGITLIILSAAGITYVIASNVSKRKKAAAGSYHSGAHRTGGANTQYRSSRDYSDGYKTSAANGKKRRENSRKYDTADVRIPRSSNGSRYKDSGSRYKDNGKRYR